MFGDDEAIYDVADLEEEEDEEEEVAVFDETIYEELEEEGFVFGDSYMMKQTKKKMKTLNWLPMMNFGMNQRLRNRIMILPLKFYQSLVASIYSRTQYQPLQWIKITITFKQIHFLCMQILMPVSQMLL